MRSVFRSIAILAVTFPMLGVGSSQAQTLDHTINLGRNPVGTVTYDGAGPGGEAYDISGGGNDTWDDFDELTYACHEFAGDFDVKVRVVSLQPTARWSKAGIMVRESLAEDSRMVFMRVTPPNVPTGNGGNGANDVVLAYRTGNVNVNGDNGGQHEDGIGSTPAYPDAWIRLSRQTKVFTGYSSVDGSNWTQVAQQDTALWSQGGFADRVTLGLSVSRHSGATPTADAVFTNYNETTPRFCLGAADSLGCPNQITLYFNRPVGAGTSNSANYAISGGMVVNGLRARPTPNTVVLLTAGLTEGSAYTVSVAPSVTDASGTVIDAGCLSASFVHGKGFEQRRIHVQYNQISDGSTGPILASQAYNMGLPVSTLGRPPSEDGAGGLFEEGMPDSGTSERFAGRIVGVLAPTANGNYRFACSSDDNSKLYLSADDQRTHKTQIAFEPQYNMSRQFASCDHRTCVGGVPVENQSAPLPLKAGGRYYLELIHSEGLGANNASAAWDAGTGNAFTNGQSPIDQSHFIPSRFSHGYLFYNLGAPAILSGPTDVTVRIGATASFTVSLDGTPPHTFYWKTNGVSVTGANSATLSVSNVQASMDDMQVSVCVSNACGGTCSGTATLHVLLNPIIVSCSSRGNCHAFYLTFNRQMRLDGAYTVICSNNINGTLTPITISGLGYAENQGIIKLNVSPDLLTDTNTYYVTIQDAHAQDGFVINPNPSICGFVHGQEYPAFRILDKKWDGNSYGNNPETFLASGRALTPPDHIYSDHIPVPPPGNGVFTDFESPWLDLDDNYADEAIGFWVVPQTGNYYFWSASDDGSKTFLATDAIPAHKVLICYEPAWAGYRQWDQNWGRGGFPVNGSVENGFPNGIPLTKGQLVYLQIDHTEGTFGDQWGVTYVINDYNPPTNGTPSALTVDQFLPKRLGPDGIIFDTLGDIFCNPGPSDQSAFVGQSASFSVAPDGTPPYSIQWKSNGVAIAGATAPGYNTAPFSEANDADTYTVTLSNGFSSTSCSARVHVRHNPLALAASTRNDPGHIYLVYNKPVALNAGNYSMDGGSLLVHSVAYGSSSSEVVITTDPILRDTIHLLKIAALVDLETPANSIVTDPTNFTLAQAPGRFCTDFSAELPPGTIASGSTPPAVGPDGSLHLTEQVNDQANYWTIPLAGVQTFQYFKARWAQLLSGPIGIAGDGVSFSAGVNLGTGFTPEQGGFNGLSVTVDTFNNGGAEVGIEVRWNGARLAFTQIGGGALNGPAELEKNVFVPATVEVSCDGLATFHYDSFVVSAQIPNYTGITANQYVFAARTGGANELAYIDDVCINDFVLGPLAVTASPASQAVPECTSATLTAVANGSPPYCFKWFRNGTLIPGASGSIYTTPTLLPADSGNVYKVVVTDLFSTANASGTVTVTPDTVPPHLVSATIGAGGVTVVFDKSLDPASANMAANYTINGGATVNSATLRSDGKTVMLNVTGAASGNCYLLSVNSIADLCPGSNVVPPGSSTVILTVPSASGPQNMVVIEAENFSANFSSSGAPSWVFDNSFLGFSGTGYMVALPDSGFNVGNGPNFGPLVYLEYSIDFPVAGNYFFWVRGGTGDSTGGGNSLHISLDGAAPNANENNRVGDNINDWGGTCPAGALSWGWVYKSAVTGAGSYVTVPSPGIHTLRITMREDGLKLDQFVLTTDPNFRLGACQAPLIATSRAAPRLWISLDANGQVVVSWDGATCILQSSSTLGGAPGDWHDLATSSPFTVSGVIGNKFYRLVSR